jgi:hypothetical protein
MHETLFTVDLNFETAHVPEPKPARQYILNTRHDHMFINRCSLANLVPHKPPCRKNIQFQLWFQYGRQWPEVIGLAGQTCIVWVILAGQHLRYVKEFWL